MLGCGGGAFLCGTGLDGEAKSGEECREGSKAISFAIDYGGSRGLEASTERKKGRHRGDRIFCKVCCFASIDTHRLARLGLT